MPPTKPLLPTGTTSTSTIRSPAKPGEGWQATQVRNCEAPPVGSLSPGSAGGEGWGEGALLTPQPATQTPARKCHPPSPCSQRGTTSTSTIRSPAKPGEGWQATQVRNCEAPPVGSLSPGSAGGGGW